MIFNSGSFRIKLCVVSLCALDEKGQIQNEPEPLEALGRTIHFSRQEESLASVFYFKTRLLEMAMWVYFFLAL